MYPIRYMTSNPKKLFEVNELEEKFFAAVKGKWPINAPSLSLIRKSDGTLSVECAGYPIGNIKLQGRKHAMSYLRGNTLSHISGGIDDYIAGIDKWIAYYERHIRKGI